MQTKNLLRKIYGVTQRKVCERKGNRKKGGGGGKRKIERKREQGGWKTGWRGTEGKRDRVLGGLTCGNPVFMDVYLSASPKGSSYFPFGNSWSLDKKSLTESGKAGGQISDGVSPSWDKDTNFLISICFCAILLNINPSFFQVWIQYIVHCHLHSMAGFADMTGCHLFKGPINVWSEAYHCVYTMCLQLKTLSLL